MRAAPLPSAEQCFSTLQQDGWLRIDRALSDAFIDECRAYLDRELAKRGERYFTVVGIDTVDDAPFAKLRDDEALQALIRRLVIMARGDAAAENLYQGNNLRVIAGDDAVAQSMKFHYDSDVLTMLLPVAIPPGSPEQAGDLILLPNRRRFGGSAVRNFVQKSLVQNAPYRRWLGNRVRGGQIAAEILRLTPGSLYFFWGYRTLHANFPCQAGEIRATALYFFGDPHPNDTLMRSITARRERREQRIWAKGR